MSCMLGSIFTYLPAVHTATMFLIVAPVALVDMILMILVIPIFAATATAATTTTAAATATTTATATAL